MLSDKLKFGDELGETCWRNGCQGKIEGLILDGCCSCHINPPCGFCTTPKEYCPECDWCAKDDHGIINDFSITYKDESKAVFASWKPRPLDPRNIDWVTRTHTNSSQLCIGVYPEGTAAKDIEALVQGTFGGRFESFGNGKFQYVAYTD